MTFVLGIGQIQAFFHCNGTTDLASDVLYSFAIGLAKMALVLPCFIVLLVPQNQIVVYLWEFDAH